MDAMTVTELPGAAAPVADAAAVNQQQPPAVNADELAAPQTQDEGKPETEKSDEGKTPKWAQRRFDRLTRERYVAQGRAELAEQRVAELEARLAASNGAQDAGNDGAQQTQNRQQPRTTNEDAYARATFDVKCNQIAAQGAKDFADFDDAMDGLKMAGLNESSLRVLVEAEEPAKVLHYLGTHPEEAEQLFGLPPVAMARKLGQIEARMSAPKPSIKPSNAPDPVKPLAAKSGGDPNALSDDLSDDEWLKRRNAQDKARRAR